MNDAKNLSHSQWKCKYHVVWIPKYRKKQLYGGVAKYLGSDSDGPAICGEIKKTSPDRTSGREGIMCQWWAVMKRLLRKCIREQEVEDQRLDQLEMFKDK
jgi:hypothetical protein